MFALPVHVTSMLYMRPVDSDLTAKARIRAVALEHFATHGVDGATLRAIAEQSGVSLALVQYHFASKEGLRAACDAYAVEFIRAQINEAIDEERLDDPAFVATAMGQAPPVLRYLGRALVDRSQAAASLFDEMVAITEERLPGGPDPRGRAAVFTAMRLGLSVLHEHLSRVLGDDVFAPEAMMRIGAAQLDIVSPSFVNPEYVDKARSGVERYDDKRAKEGS